MQIQTIEEAIASKVNNSPDMGIVIVFFKIVTQKKLDYSWRELR